MNRFVLIWSPMLGRWHRAICKRLKGETRWTIFDWPEHGVSAIAGRDFKPLGVLPVIYPPY